MWKTDFEDRNFLIRRLNQSRHVAVHTPCENLYVRETVKLFRLMFKRPLHYLYVCAKYINQGANRLFYGPRKKIHVHRDGETERGRA